MSKVGGYKPGSAVTNEPLMKEALEAAKKDGKRVITDMTASWDGHNQFRDPTSYGQPQGTATKTLPTELKQADELVEAAEKKALNSSRRGSALRELISRIMKKFKFGAALKKVLKKLPGLGKFLGGGVAILGYIADSSTAHAATIPNWVNKLYNLKLKFRKSSDPLEQLECLRKMCAITYKAHRPLEQHFNASLFAARVVYQEEPGKREQIVASMMQVFAGYRQSAGDVGYSLQDLSEAAKLLMTAVQSAYGTNSQIAPRLGEFRGYFQTFENAARGYVRISTELIPSPANVTAELMVAQSPAMTQL